MPLGPLRVVYVQPAPKSRLAVTGLSRRKGKGKGKGKGKAKASRLKPVPLTARD
jgi:hypothetical protein